MAKNDKVYITTKEATARYHISRQTLDRRHEEGLIGKYHFGKNGRRVFWEAGELEQLFTNSTINN